VAIAILLTSSQVFAQLDTTLTITNTGRVGIGTTNPIQNLEVKDNVSTGNIGISINSTAGNPQIRLLDNGTTKGAMTWIRSLNSLTFNEGTTDLLTLKSGKVGIGTTTPGQLLHVAGGTIEVYPATDGENGIRIRSADQSRNFVLDYNNNGTIRIGDNGGVMRLSSTFGVESRDFNGTWRPMIASSFDVQSSRHIKQDILHLRSGDETSWLTQIMQLKPATYRYAWESESEKKTLGFIAEELPDVIRSDDGRGVNLYALSTATVAALQAFYREYLEERLQSESVPPEMLRQLQEDNRSLSQRVSELEAIVKSLGSERRNVDANSMSELH